jgi:hypothetical protein
MKKAVGAFAALGAAGLSYATVVRPRILNYGATREEARRAMAGDDILSEVALQTTRAIYVNALPEHIWPWLVQMGPSPRGGAYTYDWIERLLGIDIENTDQILPQYQHLEPGEFLGLNDKGQGLQVREVDPGHALVLQWIPATSTWAFCLYPDGRGGSRLVSRNRLPGSGLLFRLGMVLFMEAGSLVMERKMLLGIKQRAEALEKSRKLSGSANVELQPLGAS